VHTRIRLLRCIFGNPFRVLTFDPAWRTPTVLALTQRAEAERLHPRNMLNPARLAVLADALEDAGCTHAGWSRSDATLPVSAAIVQHDHAFA
jgi:hypothetical protein